MSARADLAPQAFGSSAGAPTRRDKASLSRNHCDNDAVYTPAHFAVDEPTTARMLTELVAGDLVTCTESGLLATFLPLVFDADRGPHGALLGHVARPNDQWRLPPVGQALVIAHGPNAYVSPSWYPSKADHGRVVPTWNYATLQVHGDLVVHDDPDWVDDVVRRLTNRHESGRAQPWRVDDAPERFHAGQLRAIVGIEIAITGVEAKVKMSQNRPDVDIDGVVAGLRADGETEVADLVEQSRRDPR